MIALTRCFLVAVSLANGSAFADEPRPLKFAETKPLKNFSISEMEMNFLLFSRTDKDGIASESVGIYDHVIGVACEWTQETKERDGSYFLADATLTHKVCTFGSMPEAWKNVESGGIEQILVDAGKTPLNGDSADIEIYEGSFSEASLPEIEMRISFQREWIKSTQEVCLQTYISENDTDEAHDVSELGSLLVEHGCHQLKDYVLKSALALQPGQGI